MCVCFFACPDSQFVGIKCNNNEEDEIKVTIVGLLWKVFVMIISCLADESNETVNGNDSIAQYSLNQIKSSMNQVRNQINKSSSN